MISEFIYLAGYALATALLGVVTFAVMYYAMHASRVWVLQPLKLRLRKLLTGCRTKLGVFRLWCKRIWRWDRRGY